MCLSNDKRLSGRCSCFCTSLNLHNICSYNYPQPFWDSAVRYDTAVKSSHKIDRLAHLCIFNVGTVWLNTGRLFRAGISLSSRLSSLALSLSASMLQAVCTNLSSSGCQLLSHCLQLLLFNKQLLIVSLPQRLQGKDPLKRSRQENNIQLQRKIRDAVITLHMHNICTQA